MRTPRFAFAFPAILLLAAQAGPTDHPASDADFPFRFFRSVAASAREPNVFVSPLSASLAIGMLQSGARGETQAAIARGLGVQGRSATEIGRTDSALMHRLTGRDDVRLLIGNSLWLREGVAFQPSYLDRTRASYRAEAHSLDLSSHAFVERVNAWVAASTERKIEKLLEAPLASDDILLLLNAVYFRGDWLHPFDSAQTRSQPFHGVRGAREIPFMRRQVNVRHGTVEEVQLVRLPYRGDGVAMWVILPDSGVAPATVRERLDAGRWRRWTEAARPRDVNVVLPRFEVDYSADLRPPLEALGMGIIFDRGRADFGGMVSRQALGGENAYVSRARQRAVVEVNEAGTVAAAVTSITMSVTSVPPPPLQFLVDRPFLFVIQDDRTGAVLFIGEVGDPGAK